MNNDQISMLLAYMIQSQSSGGFVQDFLFPFLLSAISAMIGAYAAYYLLKRSEWIAEEKRKLNLLNEFSIMALDAFNLMISIKQNYHQIIDSNPRSRAISSLPVRGDLLEFKAPVEVLTLLGSSLKKTHGFKWAQPWNCMALAANYKAALSSWKMKIELDDQCKSLVMGDKAVSFLSEIELDEIIPQDKLAKWITSTEKSLVLTDDMLIQLNSLLKELPEITRRIISSKKLGLNPLEWTMSEYHEELLVRVPDANYLKVTELFKMSESELKHYFRSVI